MQSVRQGNTARGVQLFHTILALSLNLADCQKADFKRLKKSCKPPSDGAAGSLSNPTKEEMIEYATENMRLVKALKKSPEIRDARSDEDLEACTIPILRHLCDFCFSTHNKHWGRLLQPRIGVEIASQSYDDSEGWKRDMLGKMEDVQRKAEGRFDMERWPKFDQEVYQDGIHRNLMAAMVVADDSRQGMFGQPAGERYVWSDEVVSEAKAILGVNRFNELHDGSIGRS